MAKFEAGLHKKISAIFEGVPIPENDNAEQAPSASNNASNKESPDNVSPKQFIIEQLLTSSLSSQQTAHQTAHQIAQPSLGEISSEQPVVKNVGKTPWYQRWKQIENKLFVPKAGVDTSRQKKTVVLMLVLFVVFIFVIIRILHQPSPSAAQAQSSGTAGADNSAAVTEEKINWRIPELYPATLRDPMKAGLLVGGQGGSGNLIVKGIVYSEDSSSAVIDSQIVHQGEKILGVTVVKINKSSVEFEMNGKKWTQEVQR